MTTYRTSKEIITNIKSSSEIGWAVVRDGDMLSVSKIRTSQIAAIAEMEYLYRCYNADQAPFKFEVVFVVRDSGVVRRMREPTWLEPVYVGEDLIGMRLPDSFPAHHANFTQIMRD